MCLICKMFVTFQAKKAFSVTFIKSYEMASLDVIDTISQVSLIL